MLLLTLCCQITELNSSLTTARPAPAVTTPLPMYLPSHIVSGPALPSPTCTHTHTHTSRQHKGLCYSTVPQHTKVATHHRPRCTTRCNQHTHAAYKAPQQNWHLQPLQPLRPKLMYKNWKPRCLCVYANTCSLTSMRATGHTMPTVAGSACTKAALHKDTSCQQHAAQLDNSQQQCRCDKPPGTPRPHALRHTISH